VESVEDNKTARFVGKAFVYTKYLPVIGYIAQMLNTRLWEQNEWVQMIKH